MSAGIAPVAASPVADASRLRLSRGQPTWVIVEFEASAVDRDAQTERLRRNLARDDAAVLDLRSKGYRAVKARVETAAGGRDVTGILDYSHLPLSAWRLVSSDALARLQAMPEVRRVHENGVLRPVSVSDLGFIGQPASAASGATGTGTTIAVIDGGMANNYLNYSDFGSCTAVNTPASTCRVALVRTTYPGASAESAHGTNVAAIALGVAPRARLAMFDVFNGTSTSFADVLTAMNYAIANSATYNIVAINLSLGDASSHVSPCTSSAFGSAVTNASSAGITTVAAAGNSGSKSGLAEPACVPGVVSVGAVYDGNYGSRGWVAAAAPGGTCTDASTADLVTCFSQSANYLSLLAPGSFVNSPDASFQQSGTSQAAPHVAGAVAVLRARYPAESLNTTLQRLQTSGTLDVDPGNNRSVPRLQLFAASQLGTALALSGTGPTTAAAGTSATYSLTVTNNGPLMATNVNVAYALPAGATFVSASAGCANSGAIVNCSAASLGVGWKQTFTITLRWTVDGPIYTAASLVADQINSAAAGQQVVAFGSLPATGGDAPLPLWAWALLACGLLVISARHGTQVAIQKAQQVRKGLS